MTTIKSLLERDIRDFPSRIAISDSTRSLDYASVDRIAGGVAAELRRIGIRRGDRVAVSGVRDARLLALLYAVMHAGAAACVIASQWGEIDVRRRLSKIGTRCVLTTDPGGGSMAPFEQHALDIDELARRRRDGSSPGPDVTSADTAYLSFTSGSSGEPKAVAISHGNVAHYALGIRDRLGWTDADGVCTAHVTTLSADLGHTSWLLALATAGQVLVVEDELSRDPHGFWSVLAANEVTCLKTAPSHLRALLDGRPPDAPPIDTLVLGGETMSRSLAVDLLMSGTATRIVNHYGPTETTVGAMCFVASSVSELPSDETSLPIGTAIGGAVLHLEDSGELLIGGPGVALEYDGAPDTTAHSFAMLHGERVYRTGDLCRLRSDGDLVFLGRIDRQVKVSGYRVDPSEIEHVLSSCPGVAQSAVLVRETSADRRLTAAVRLESHHDRDEDATTMIRAYLQECLASFSIPSPIVILPAFPVGPTGKVDTASLVEAVDALLAERAAQIDHTGVTDDTGTDNASTDDTMPLARVVADLWAEMLGLPEVSPDADFLEIGGDSILAMRTVASVGRHDLRLTVDDVYQHRTPAQISTAARHASRSDAADPTGPQAPPTLGPAQRWFFAQQVSQPDHWNQAIVLRCSIRVDPGALSAAVRAVIERHSTLRRPLTAAGPGPAARPVSELNPISFSRLPRNPVTVAETVAGVGAELNRSLDLAAGNLVRVHLFTGSDGIDDRIVVVVHHLVIDGVSWRILISDLAASYSKSRSGHSAVLPSSPDYYNWSRKQPPAAALAACSTVPPASKPAALTWSLDQSALARLGHLFGRGQTFEATLLAAFTNAVGSVMETCSTTIEVETHGRGAAAADALYVETVGWFSAAKWLQLATGASGTEVEQALRETEAMPMDFSGSRPKIGFNFLGTFRLPTEPTLGWTASDESAGPTRCPDGDPLYDLRLTARIVSDRLVTDIVYRPDSVTHEHAASVYRRFAASVSAYAGLDRPGAVLRTPTSTSGMVLCTGAVPRVRAHVRHEPACVFLTGATGYLGSHVLRAITARGARVTCLVRRQDADLGPEVDRGAVDVVVGDITRPGLGITGTDMHIARRGVTSVVHAAGDVRLLAPPSELNSTNVDGLRELIRWMDEAEPVPLHHVSTLAVAGYVDGPRRRFSEAHFWIGQRFMSPYERSKFEAEKLARTWAAQGRPLFIYRMGHIAADSRTGALHRNAGENRIYQTLRGYVLAGAAPSRPSATLAFSHVDTVAAGLAATALDPNSAPGVHHLESPYDVMHDNLVAWLRDFGYRVLLTNDTQFEQKVARLAEHDPYDAQLASAWARHIDRNVRFDRTMTLAALSRRGIRFTEPTPRWRSQTLSWMVDSGVLPPPTRIAAFP